MEADERETDNGVRAALSLMQNYLTPTLFQELVSRYVDPSEEADAVENATGQYVSYQAFSRVSEQNNSGEGSNKVTSPLIA
jgi:hypothetical protein